MEAFTDEQHGTDGQCGGAGSGEVFGGKVVECQ